MHVCLPFIYLPLYLTWLLVVFLIIASSYQLSRLYTLNTFKQIDLEQLKNVVSDMTIKTSPEDPLPQPVLKN